MKRTHLAPAFVLLVSATSMAQEELGLLEVYEQALLNDPVIREAEANFLATAEVKPQARSVLLPSLRLSGSTTDSYSERDAPQNPVSGDPDPFISSFESDSDSTNLNLNLSQTVFDWGAFVSLKQADKTIARAEADLEAVRQDLMLRVATAYFDVLAAEDLLAADVAAREALAQQLEQTQRRHEVGLIAITNVQEAQAGYDTAVAQVIASERALATAQERLREIIDIYVTDLEAPIEDLPLEPPNPNDVDAWVNAALEQNLSLISSRIAAEVALDDIRIARSSRFPILSISANASDSEGESQQRNNLLAGGTDVGPIVASAGQGDSVSLNLNLPIFQGGANGSRVQQAVYRSRAAIEGVERVARQTERLTRDAYLGVTSEIIRVGALRQALQSAQTALTATQAGEEVGQRTAVDVVNAQNNLRRAETQYAAARYQYLLNVLRLKQAAGTLTADDLAEIDESLE